MFCATSNSVNSSLSDWVRNSLLAVFCAMCNLHYNSALSDLQFTVDSALSDWVRNSLLAVFCANCNLQYNSALSDSQFTVESVLTLCILMDYSFWFGAINLG